MAAYNFIVVGAGSAGCAVAGGLATHSSSRVLLIEAGGSDRRLTVRAPLAFGRQFGTSLDWAYESEPEPGCADRRIGQPRGRVLGGTCASPTPPRYPRIPRANTNAPSIMIGERCADFLLAGRQADPAG